MFPVSMPINNAKPTEQSLEATQGFQNDARMYERPLLPMAYEQWAGPEAMISVGYGNVDFARLDRINSPMYTRWNGEALKPFALRPTDEQRDIVVDELIFHHRGMNITDFNTWLRDATQSNISSKIRSMLFTDNKLRRCLLQTADRVAVEYSIQDPVAIDMSKRLRMLGVTAEDLDSLSEGEISDQLKAEEILFIDRSIEDQIKIIENELKFHHLEMEPHELIAWLCDATQPNVIDNIRGLLGSVDRMTQTKMRSCLSSTVDRIHRSYDFSDQEFNAINEKLALLGL